MYDYRFARLPIRGLINHVRDDHRPDQFAAVRIGCGHAGGDVAGFLICLFARVCDDIIAREVGHGLRIADSVTGSVEQFIKDHILPAGNCFCRVLAGEDPVARVEIKDSGAAFSEGPAGFEQAAYFPVIAECLRYEQLLDGQAAGVFDQFVLVTEEAARYLPDGKPSLRAVEKLHGNGAVCLSGAGRECDEHIPRCIYDQAC